MSTLSFTTNEVLHQQNWKYQRIFNLDILLIVFSLQLLSASFLTSTRKIGNTLAQ